MGNGFSHTRRMRRAAGFLGLGVGCLGLVLAAAQDSLPGTQPLTVTGDVSAEMVRGIGRFLDLQTERARRDREKYWQRDFASAQRYEASIQENRSRLRTIIGATETRVAFKRLGFVSSSAAPAVIHETEAAVTRRVSWPVLEGVSAEGLWLLPKSPAGARVVVLPDADQTPEMLAGIPGHSASRCARALAERGCEVLIPVLISRSDAFSGNPRLNRYTNQPHREWIYRQAYEMGRHIIGFEVQKVLAAVDFFQLQGLATDGRSPPTSHTRGELICGHGRQVEPGRQAGGHGHAQRGAYSQADVLPRHFQDLDPAGRLAAQMMVRAEATAELQHPLGRRTDGLKTRRRGNPQPQAGPLDHDARPAKMPAARGRK